MRVFIGLSALLSLSVVSAQQICSLSFITGTTPTTAQVASGLSASATVNIYNNVVSPNANGFATPSSNSFLNLPVALGANAATQGNLNLGSDLPGAGASWTLNIGSAVTSLLFSVKTNTLVGQLQYRYSGSPYGNLVWICDPCSTTTVNSYIANSGNLNTNIAQTCDVSNGPQTANTAFPQNSATGYLCAAFTRTYMLQNMATGSNSFGFAVWDVTHNPNPNKAQFAFTLLKATGSSSSGDPQIVGMQGQDFQVHGMPDEIFNIVTYPSVQVNARFTYLESAECHDNFTACFAHPGTYISEQGFRLGKDKVRITAGSYKKGLQVHVNGKKIKQNVDLKSGAVELVNHRRVIVHTDIMRFIVSNSDKFMNQELELQDDKLIALGAEHKVLKDNERFHPEVPLHGLQGQTWRNVEYPSGLDYEGSIMDYHVVDGNLFGTDFVFNQFKA